MFVFRCSRPALRDSLFAAAILLALSCFQVPAHAQCASKETAKLVASDGAAFDYFGAAVSLSGNRILVGSRYTDATAQDSGAAYIFEFDGFEWKEAAKLVGADSAAGEGFACSVSLSGTRALVGASFHGHPGIASGAAYVFEFNGTSWVQTAELVASDPGSGTILGEGVGFSVALEGDRALLGAPYEDVGGSQSGCAYVFDLTGSSWVQTAKLTASDAHLSDQFGYSVALRSTRALIGAHYSGPSGAAYVFDLVGSAWVQHAKLIAANAEPIADFGSAVSLSDHRALIGADGDGIGGQAYVFEWSGTSWSQSARLAPPNGADQDNFGNSVSIVDDRILIGARLNDAAAPGGGSAYLYEHIGSTWKLAHHWVASDPSLFQNFGWSIALDGNRAVVGAGGDDDVASGAGAAYVIDLCVPWTDLGGADPGLLGDSVLAGTGTLATSSTNGIALTNAMPHAPGLLLVALGPPGSMAFFGGTLKAFPVAAFIDVATSPSGSVVFPFTTPPGISGVDLVLQFALVDAAASQGVALSNAILAKFP